MSVKDHSEGGGSEDEQKHSRKSPYIWKIKGKQHMREVENNRDLEYDSYSEPTTSSLQRAKCIDTKTPITDSVDCHFRNYLAGALELNKSFRDGPDKLPMDEYIDMNESAEDNYWQQWHANQLASSFIDNTINTVLETWFNSSNDEHIEDDAMLIAIESHGIGGTR